MISSRSSGDAVVLDRDAATERDLGLRHAVEPQHPLLERAGPVEHARAAASVSTAAAHIGRSSPGGPGSTTTSGPAPSAGGTTSPGAVPTGSRIVAPSGTIACLRLPARIASSL